MGQKKHVRELKKYISLRKFLEIYYDIKSNNNDFIMSHKDAKELMPFLKRVSFDEIEEKKVYTGQIIIVQDSYGNYAPYIIDEIEDLSSNFDCNPNKQELPSELEISSKSSRYELCLICRTTRKLGKSKINREASKLLKEKKCREQTAKYKKKKLEEKYDGKY